MPHVTIPFEYDPITCPYIRIQVRINGGKPLPFLVDTGMDESILIDTAVAQQLRLRPVKASNKRGTDNLAIHKVRVSGITFVVKSAREHFNLRIASAFAADLGIIRKLGYAGIVGAPLFAGTPVQIDFKAKTIALFLKPLSPLLLREAARLPVREEEGKYFVTVFAAGGQAASLLVDTGSRQTYIPLSIAAYMQPLARTTTVHDTVNALHTTDKWLLPSLNFGPLVVPNVAVCLAGTPKVGLNVLSRFRVILDFPNSCLYLQRPGEQDQPACIGGWTGISIERRGKAWHIAGVEPNSPADQSSVQQGDLLLEIDGQAATSLALYKVGLLLSGLAGTPTRLTLQNKQGQSYQVSLVRKSEFERPPSEMLGMLADKQAGGPMVVSHILDDSPAQRQGLKQGDTITSINGQPVARMSLEEAAIQLGLSQITLTVQRKGEGKPLVFHLH